MQPIDPNQPNIALRYRTLLTLWFAMLMSVVMYLVFIEIAKIRFASAATSGNQKLSLLLICLSLLPMSLSFLVKQSMLANAIEQQKLQSVQPAYVVAWALCEVATLLGLFLHFALGSRYYYVAFVVGGLGMLLHFPQKKHLLEASSQEF